MTHVRLFGMAFLIVVAVPLTAAAQICAGGVDISSQRPGALEAGMGFSEGATGVGGGAVFGSDAALAGVWIARTSADDVDLSSVSFEVRAGGQVAATPDRRAMICPVLGFSYETLQDDLGNVKTFSPGVAVGFVAATSPTVAVIPFAHIAFNRASFSSPLLDDSVSDTFGTLGLGLGLTLHERFGIQPRIDVPFGADDFGNTFSLTFQVGFPR